MEISSSRFKAIAATLGISFWFFIITSTMGIFSIENLLIFFSFMMIITQVFAIKLSKGLDIFAKINTKIFLGILFVTVFTVYGIYFKILKIDLLRQNSQDESYWITIDKSKPGDVFKQY